LRTPSDFDRAYLAGADPRAQSGFHGSAERWEAARRPIVDAIDRPGTFLDVGCANGLLMESVAAWSPHAVEPYGIDFAPGLVELARTRLPQWADRIWLADARTWRPPFRFAFVHVRLDLEVIDEARALGRRVIFSSDGSFRRPDSPRAKPVAERLRKHGLEPVGELYRRSEEHLVEISVAWVDQAPSDA
jgi:SAM-dependent methyltransferase